MVVSHIPHLGLFSTTAICCGGTPGVETATCGWKNRRRRFSLDATMSDSTSGVWNRNAVEQDPCVVVRGSSVQVFRRSHFAQLAQVHDRDSVADVLHDGEVVGNEDESEPVRRLQVFEQIENLSLNAHVKG